MLQPPFKAANMEELFKVVCKGKYEPVPVDRYDSARELNAVLEELLQVSVVMRPTASEILKLQCVKRKMLELNKIRSKKGRKELKQMSKHVSRQKLMDTIRVPVNLEDLNLKLPLP